MKKLLFWIIVLILSFNTSFANTSPQLDTILSWINDKTLVSKYVIKLDSIDGKVNPSKNDAYIQITNSFQKRFDELDKSEFQTSWKIEPYMKEIASKVKKIVSVNSDYEYEENWNTKRLELSSIIRIKNDAAFLRTVLRTYDLSNQILMLRSWEYILSISWFNIENKLTRNKILNKAKLVIPEPTDKWNWVFVFENKKWYYALDTTKYTYSIIPWDFYLSQYSNLTQPTTWTIMNSNSGIKVLNDFKIYDIPISVPTSNKKLVLDSIAEDTIHYYSWTINTKSKEIFEEIRGLTNDIVKGKNTDDEKILAIYSWIAKNVSYDKNVSNAIENWTLNLDDVSSDFDKNIFSWLWTFYYRSWVCQGYTKLFAYMLSVAWVNDVDIEFWSANNGKWYIPHAWVRIWNYYYDVTFDDNNNGGTRPFIWYKLPKEIIYATRSYWNDVSWRVASKEQLQEKLTLELTPLLWKYGNQYNIFTYLWIK